MEFPIEIYISWAKISALLKLYNDGNGICHISAYAELYLQAKTQSIYDSRISQKYTCNSTMIQLNVNI